MLDPQNALTLWNEIMQPFAGAAECPGSGCVLGIDSFQNSSRDTLWWSREWSHIVTNKQKRCVESGPQKTFVCSRNSESEEAKILKSFLIWQYECLSHNRLLSFVLSLLFRFTFLIKVKWWISLRTFQATFWKKNTTAHSLCRATRWQQATPQTDFHPHRIFQPEKLYRKNGRENWLHFKRLAEWHCFRILDSSVHCLPCRRRKIPGFVPCRGNMLEGSAQRGGRVELFIFNTRKDLICLKISELIHCITCDKYLQLEYVLGLW